MNPTIPGTLSVAFGSSSGIPRPRPPVSSRYHSLARAARSALAPGAAGLELAYDLARLGAALDELAEARQGLGRVDLQLRRLEHRGRVVPRLGEVARAAQDGCDRHRSSRPRRELLIRQARERLDRQ